jgi:hypothetical protein
MQWPCLCGLRMAQRAFCRQAELRALSGYLRDATVRSILQDMQTAPQPKNNVMSVAAALRTAWDDMA